MSSLKSSMEPDKAASIMYVDEGYGLHCTAGLQILLTQILPTDQKIISTSYFILLIQS